VSRTCQVAEPTTGGAPVSEPETAHSSNGRGTHLSTTEGLRPPRCGLSGDHP
jgi:hypothetical protein